MTAMKFALATAVAAGLTGAAIAEEALKATERFSTTGIAFELEGEYSNLTLTVTGPDGYYVGTVSEKGAPSVDLREGGTLTDGVYSYELSGATPDTQKVVREYFNNGRDRGAKPMLGAATRGSFVVQRGSIVKLDPRDSEER